MLVSIGMYRHLVQIGENHIMMLQWQSVIWLNILIDAHLIRVWFIVEDFRHFLECSMSSMRPTYRSERERDRDIEGETGLRAKEREIFKWIEECFVIKFSNETINQIDGKWARQQHLKQSLHFTLPIKFTEYIITINNIDILTVLRNRNYWAVVMTFYHLACKCTHSSLQQMDEMLKRWKLHPSQLLHVWIMIIIVIMDTSYCWY